MTDQEKVIKLRAMLQTMLGNVDYLNGCCSMMSPVAAALPKEVIEDAHTVLDMTKPEGGVDGN